MQLVPDVIFDSFGAYLGKFQACEGIFMLYPVGEQGGRNHVFQYHRFVIGNLLRFATN